MSRCDCGFDFVQARLKGRKLESYALISDDNYRAVIRKENAILNERNPEKRLTLIGKAAPSVGSLVRCPKCGAWVLRRPLRTGRGNRTVLRKSESTANKAVPQTGVSHSTQRTNRKSLAAGSRRGALR
jgi:hypothetical protein